MWNILVCGRLAAASWCPNWQKGTLTLLPKPSMINSSATSHSAILWNWDSLQEKLGKSLKNSQTRGGGSAHSHIITLTAKPYYVGQGKNSKIWPKFPNWMWGGGKWEFFTLVLVFLKRLVSLNSLSKQLVLGWPVSIHWFIVEPFLASLIFPMYSFSSSINHWRLIPDF